MTSQHRAILPRRMSGVGAWDPIFRSIMRAGFLFNFATLLLAVGTRTSLAAYFETIIYFEYFETTSLGSSPHSRNMAALVCTVACGVGITQTFLRRLILERQENRVFLSLRCRLPSASSGPADRDRVLFGVLELRRAGCDQSRPVLGDPERA